jgi:hypothetical protein
MRYRSALLGALLALLLAPDIAGACAALFSPDADVRQSAQRIIFAVDAPRGTVEAYVSVQYVGAAEEFAWIVPLPSNPQVDVVAADSFDAIERATNPRFLLPSESCASLRDLSPGLTGSAPPEGAPGGVDVYQQGQVGPYDFSVIGGSSGGLLSDWLRQNGYRVTDSMEPLIDSYADAGMLFLAMKLQGGQDVGAIAPVKLTFTAQQAMIPLRLAAVGAEPGTELLVWVFAAGQVAPTNMERLTIPEEQVVVTSFGGGHNYAELLQSAVVRAAGRGLVTEAAIPTSALGSGEDALIDELSARFPYLTRFYGRFDPEQMTIDPAFAPQVGLADIPVVHDLTDRVNPYDCASQTVLAAADQPFAASSPQGVWIAWRWLLVPALAAVAIGALALQLRRRGARR